MSLFSPSLHFTYLAKLYFKNLFSILFGLSFAFAMIDYFQSIQELHGSFNVKILYIFYKWQEALGLLYPLAIVFAVIMTKLSLIKSNTMGAFHAFGYDKKKLFRPIFTVALLTYFSFLLLHSTDFSYAKDKAKLLRKNQTSTYKVEDVFFKYEDTFIYINKLEPITQTITDMTIFKIREHQVAYTIHAPYAVFENQEWIAYDAIVKTHFYEDKNLLKYKIEHKKRIATLEGYRPNIIESLYEGKAFNILDALHTWKLLNKQSLNTDKIRAIFYEKVITPLFSLALLLILFFKLPFHARMMNTGLVVAFSLSLTFITWGLLFGLGQMSANGALLPELTVILPISLLLIYASILYKTNEKSLS